MKHSSDEIFQGLFPALELEGCHASCKPHTLSPAVFCQLGHYKAAFSGTTMDTAGDGIYDIQTSC